MRLLRSRFLRIAILPNFVFALGLLLQALSSGVLTDSTISAFGVFEESGADITFFVVRNILLVGYSVGAIYLIYEYFKAKKRNRAVFIRSLVIVGVGILVSQFALFFALLFYNVISRIFT